ncbi:MAG: Asp-tRNA(Asn)/Glu-tRNA(Gln) amidotransferase subunit GatC [SAR324 cluster bacterium]|nr:Asp-tRNA(Asn)/Glu-tRNA(Gln) amidotransferase subunit GatC [SAR324 cluster bacterium]
MTSSFSTDEVRKIARLSSLELTDKETEVFAEQFSGILDYFELLKKADIPEAVTDADESHLSGIRDDKMEKSPVAPEQFSAYLENGFFKVPRVIDQGN